MAGWKGMEPWLAAEEGAGRGKGEGREGNEVESRGDG